MGIGDGFWELDSLVGNDTGAGDVAASLAMAKANSRSLGSSGESLVTREPSRHEF